MRFSSLKVGQFFRFKGLDVRCLKVGKDSYFGFSSLETHTVTWDSDDRVTPEDSFCCVGDLNVGDFFRFEDDLFLQTDAGIVIVPGGGTHYFDINACIERVEVEIEIQ